MSWAALTFCLTLLAHGSDFSTERKTYAGTEFDIVRVDPAAVQLRLYWLKADGTPYARLNELRSRLQAQGAKFLMATNSGIYDQTYRPLGLHVENSKQLRPINKSSAPGGNFSLVPNGIFLLNKSGVQVIETSEYASLKEPARFATQSGPLLLHLGKIHPSFTAESENRKLRSGVGVDAQGRAVFAISRGRVNFFDFAMLFKTQLGCASALYLDGTISQLLLGQEPAEESPVAFAGIWAATRP